MYVRCVTAMGKDLAKEARHQFNMNSAPPVWVRVCCGNRHISQNHNRLSPSHRMSLTIGRNKAGKNWQTNYNSTELLMDLNSHPFFLRNPMAHTLKDTKAYKQKYWMRVPSDFKRVRRRSERSRIKHAIHNGDEPPRIRNSDKWEYF